ncbi:MAG: hypothetical protein QM813_19380 [Verrucomicrobiota bacterium]
MSSERHHLVTDVTNPPQARGIGLGELAVAFSRSIERLPARYDSGGVPLTSLRSFG